VQQSFTVANDFGVIDLDEASVGDEWNSGEVLAVTLTDQDLNKNTWLDEDLTIADPSGQQAGSDLIPSMQIGSPLSLTTPPTGEATLDGVENSTIASFSKIGIVGTTTTDSIDTDSTAIMLGHTVSTLRTAVAASDYAYINYNVKSLITGGVDSINIYDQSATPDAGMDAVTTFSGNSTVGMVAIENLVATGTFDDAHYFTVNFTHAAGESDYTLGDRYYVDIFTFGDGPTV